MPRRVGGYRFGHALIRETLYAELTAVQRVRIHRRIGETLETLYSSEPEPHLAELSHHFVQAAPGGDVERAIAYARQAGERAMALLAFEDAAAHFELALQVLDLLEAPDEAQRCDLLLALAAAQVNAGDVTTGRGTYLRAARLAKTAGLPEQLARAALGFGGEPIAAWGFDAELVRVLEDALGLLGDEDSSLRAQLLTRLATEYSDVDSGRLATLVHDAEAMARRLGDVRALAFALIGRTHVLLDRYEGGEPLVATGNEMAELGEVTGDRGLICSAVFSRLCGHLLAGDMAATDREIEAYARMVEESRHPFYLFWTPTFRALRALSDGRFADAERSIAEATALVPRAHLAHWVFWYAPNLFALRREQGNPADAEQTLRDVIAETLDPARDLAYRAMLALAYFETGRTDEARREFEEIAADDFASVRRRSHRDTNIIHGLGYLAEVCAALADAPRAATLYGLLLPHAAQYLVYGGTWHVAGSASHYLGMLASTLDRWAAAVRHFEDALAMNGRMGAPPFVARTQLAYAAMLARRDAPGDRARARALTDAVLATANELGMIRLAAEATALRPILVPHGTEAAGAVTRSGLTERELDVLRLLVAGRSNPEIAETLFISPATARTHVSNVFAKLGVHSRTEAVDYAHRRGLLLSDPTST
jgi:DNA-binding CsgD family transcriptional regulator/tetratricopeptide (TPR) repeat protein